MKYFKIISVAIIVIAMSASTCGDDKNNNVDIEKLPPVETREPNSNYKPAFEGQTRINGVKTKAQYDVTVINDQLNKPWGISPLPDGRMVITEKRGAIRIAKTDGSISEPIYGFPKVDDRGQGGLLDVAPSPDFDKSRVLFFTLAEMTEQGSLTSVGKAKLANDEASIENFEIIFRAIPYFDNSIT